MVKLSVNETKWSSLPARTRALILYISILMFDFGPEKLPGLSRNGPLGTRLRPKRKMAGSGSVVEQVALLKCQEFELFKANLMERRTHIKKG